jgi:hypothetical protein
MVICSRAVTGSAWGGQPLPSLLGHQVAPLREAVVIEHRLDALLPLAALRDERVPQPHPGPQVENVIGRDPRLRQPSHHHQLAQMPRVRAIVLSAPLVPTSCGGLRRLGQMHRRADPPQLLDDESPAGRRLQRDLELAPAEALQKPPHARAVGRHHTSAAHLAAGRIQPIGRDLRSMLIESHYDRHRGLLTLHGLNACADTRRA